MNFLAHLYFSEPSPEAMAGNLMADFIRGAPHPALPEATRRGIRLHRWVDVYADAHPDFQTSTKRLSPRWRHYSGVLVDMFYDHFLAANWPEFHGDSLRDFADRVYRALESQTPIMPPLMERAVCHMIEHDWLGSYAETAGLETALRRMSRRTRRAPRPLDAAMVDLEIAYRDLEGDFRRFFSDISRDIIRVENDLGAD